MQRKKLSWRNKENHFGTLSQAAEMIVNRPSMIFRRSLKPRKMSQLGITVIFMPRATAGQAESVGRFLGMSQFSLVTFLGCPGHQELETLNHPKTACRQSALILSALDLKTRWQIVLVSLARSFTDR